jgi:uncharacterized protein YjbK
MNNLAQEIEIEFKTVLTYKEFVRLKQGLPFPKQPIKQTNYYFETKNFDLKKCGSALRIRKKGLSYTLTLKEPHREGILETHDILTEHEFNGWIANQMSPKQHTAHQLSKMGIDVKKLIYYGSLQTDRFTFEKGDIQYFLDKSDYHQQTDYEFELEAGTYATGREAFQQALQKFQIREREPVTKIARYFGSLPNVRGDI